MDIQFVGEHLLPGKWGHFSVILSFVAAAFTVYCYIASVAGEKNDTGSTQVWRSMARVGFFIHTGAVIGIFGALYYIITNHLFEYHYAWEHSSLDMPGKYLLSCFWEGQQGSFMLWTFWNCVLGLVVMRTSGTLETRVMAIIALVQVFLCSMLLGFYFGADAKVGSTPFDLLRHAMQMAPIFSKPDYLQFVKDGNGLNVLLQNYWMVIHPPILFLGFATTLVPFAYCVAALWKNDYQAFVKPVLNWSLFNGAVLGTGIMMGGAWAYESLNFGGYWAWDPVENSSLVPWLTLIAGIHTLLSYKSTGRALHMTLAMFLLTHLLVWYSTFLTRTGILGNTSVHAFTGDGSSMSYHLVIVIGILLLIGLVALIFRWRTIPEVKKEEETLSREFWLFIGSAILFISSFHIALMTSVPVWSPVTKYFTGKDFTLIDPMSHYNSVQVWIAVLIGLLAGCSLFMKYKHTDAIPLAKKLALPFIVSMILTALIAVNQKIGQFQYDLMLFTSLFGMAAAVFFAISIWKGNVLKRGPATAHFGFAMVMLGILLSSYNKHVISNNQGELFQFNKGNDAANMKESMENVILFRHKTTPMGEYQATYIGDSAVPGKDLRVYYKVNFVRKDSATGKEIENFFLYPDAFINPKGQQGLSASPSTQHYWDRDIFTFINAVKTNSPDEKSEYKSTIVNKPGDTIFTGSGFMVFNGFSKNIDSTRYAAGDSDLGVTAALAAYDAGENFIKNIRPIYILKNRSYIDYLDDSVQALGMSVRFNLILKTEGDAKAEILVKKYEDENAYVVLKAIVFPYINVLWLGVVVMVFGFFISIAARLRLKVAE